MTLIALLLLSIVPRDDVLEDRADAVEINTLYSEEGCQVFTQVIWHDHNDARECDEVVAWRIIKAPQQLPVYDWQRGCWECLWNDGDVLRRVRTTSYFRTHTQAGWVGDPELNARAELPPERRRGLTERRRELRAGAGN